MGSSLLLHSLLFLILCLYLTKGSPNPDLEPLIAFKTASDSSNKLASWNRTTNLCSWPGVSCTENRVSRLVLQDLNLVGSMESLTTLSHLWVLSLKRNHLSGPIPDLSNLTRLRLLFLSHNSFSGEFPASVASLRHLYRLDFSHNKLSGEIPASVSGLEKLLTLRLEGNRLNGSIPALSLPNLQEFNVSGNFLSGRVPGSVSGFPSTAFERNSGLCGTPFPNCENFEPGAATAAASPENAEPAIIESSPSSNPATQDSTPAGNTNPGPKTTRLAVALIVVGDVAVLALVSGLLVFCFCKRFRPKNPKTSHLQTESEKIIYSSSQYPLQTGTERGRMVFFHGMKRFEVEDLLRASAEMLGRGGLGTTYKAVLEDGNVVAVKRLREAVEGGKREFEQEMEVLGRLRHPNVVGLKGYYFAREERLLVYEFMENGSLFSLLHGNRGPGRTPLNWTTRMKIAAGTAHGLAFIHHASPSKLCHGNVKSTNILIDKTGNARLSDFGLSSLASPSLPTRYNPFGAPELCDGRKFSQKADVFSFGVVLLETLTGKCPVSTPESGHGVVDLPRWVQSVVREEWTAEVFDLELMRYKDIEEEMVGMLQIGMACTSAAPDQRPRISQVVRMIEEILGREVSPSHESFDSVSD